jgi:hypothetical protein
MTAFDNITKAKTIWAFMMPTTPMPDDAVIYRWLLDNSMEDFERACSRTQWRFKNAEYDATIAFKFMTASLAWFRQQEQQKDTRRTK